MSRRVFRRALMNATDPLLMCMALLLERRDFVSLVDLEERCGCFPKPCYGQFFAFVCNEIQILMR